MGKIYELLRELEIKENTDYGDNVFDVYVSFDNFIEFLEVYCKDRKEIILTYLLGIDDFLKLDVYYNPRANLHCLTDFIGYSYDGSNLAFPNGESADDWSYLTESYLLDELDMDGGDLFWKIDDIVSIKEISNLGIDKEVFNNFLFYVDSDTYQKALQENKFLSKRIELLRQGTNDTEIQQMAFEIQALAKELELAKTENSKLTEKLKNLGASKDDELLHPRTANNAAKIMLAMAELLNWNLSKPYAKETNGKILEILEMHGNKLGNDVVADWLRRAYDVGK